jgi:hypothetical protein
MIVARRPASPAEEASELADAGARA